MRREITQKFLGEVVEVGRFVMGIGLGGFVGWVLAASAASPAAHLHTWTAASVSLLCVAIVGLALWVLGAVIKPDAPPTIGLPQPPHGGRGSASVGPLPDGRTEIQWEAITGSDDDRPEKVR